MKVKGFIGIIFLVLLSGCKCGTNENSAFVKALPEQENVSEKLNYIFTYGFSFTDNFRVDKIGVEKISQNQFRIFYFFCETQYLEEVESLNIAFRVYPEKPMEFEKRIDQESKARTIASNCSLSRMAENVVVISDVFSLSPKALKETKIYLYNPEVGVVGRTMTILDLNFEF